MAKKPGGFVGMKPDAEIESYDAVPWFRKAWFALFPLFWFIPVLLIIALTGDVYLKANSKLKEVSNSDAEVWRSTAATRAFYIVVSLFFMVTLTRPFLL